MCTGFVRRENDVICGFNMDINIGVFDYDVYAEPDKFYIGIKNNIGMEDEPSRFGYYGKDRYDKVMDILRNSTDDFSVQDGLHLLKEVKQEGNWATRVSFVYSANENAVYYALERNFDQVKKHQFEKV